MFQVQTEFPNASGQYNISSDYGARRWKAGDTNSTSFPVRPLTHTGGRDAAGVDMNTGDYQLILIHSHKRWKNAGGAADGEFGDEGAEPCIITLGEPDPE